MAFFAAAEAGVFVADSAGNSGKAGASTLGVQRAVGHQSVAAGTHGRTFYGES